MRYRLAAGYLGVDTFELMARVERGEHYWLHWAETGRDAEIDAYGTEWPLVRTSATVQLALKSRE